MPLALWGAVLGIPGFAAIVLSSILGEITLFLVGTFAIGLGIGLFGHGTLTATMRAAPPNRIGLALGAWGAVQATAAGIGIALAGIVRDGLVAIPHLAGPSPAAPYNAVFTLEAVLLLVAIAVAVPLARSARGSVGMRDGMDDRTDSTHTVEVA
jgi:BCD family chlorophyll transporter-like MFS transporter